MLRFFENLVDPYLSYAEQDNPPTRLWPFLKEYLVPFRGVLALAIIFKTIVAFGDVAIVWYMGRLIDYLSLGTPAEVWALKKTEVLIVAAVIVVVRPILAGIDVALLHNTILPNFGTMMRWRAHRHVLRQPVGWFENDFAGRIANRIMQTPPAAGEAVFQVLDAVTFALTTVIGAMILLGDADVRLLIP
ncbi:ABC transporter transmembrane domain-containing protein, partial [Flavimaricola sp.]